MLYAISDFEYIFIDQWMLVCWAKNQVVNKLIVMVTTFLFQWKSGPIGYILSVITR